MTDVTAALISKAMDNPEFKKNPVITIKAEDKPSTLSSQFQINTDVLKDILNNSKETVLILESSSGKLQLPVNSLFSAVSKQIVPGQKIIITISNAASEYKVKLSAQFGGSAGTTLVGEPMDFQVHLVGNGKEAIISNFSDYVGHVVNVGVTQDVNAVYSGLTYDSVNQIYVPVPTTWEWKDGVLQVTMKRKGNSVYAIVQKDVQFNDLTNSNPFIDSILALANRNVISGYADGSFKADQVVTRAEFATMLNRALGILPSQQSARSFKDVKAGAWYETQVNAAVDAGLINGFTDGTFRPTQEITHQEMIVMLANALNNNGTIPENIKPGTTTVPQNVAVWAKPYYVIAFEHGLLPIDSTFKFQTNKKTERQESAFLLYQLMKVLKLTNDL